MRELIEVDGLRSFAVVGYSLGGNLALKLAGDFGAHPPKELCAVCAVSPTMDLAECVEALERPSNRIYQRHFVRNLKKRMRRKIGAFPGQFSVARFRRFVQSASSMRRTRRRFMDSTAPRTTTIGRARCA